MSPLECRGLLFWYRFLGILPKKLSDANDLNTKPMVRTAVRYEALLCLS